MSNINEEFKSFLKNWVIYDNTIKKYNQHIKKLKDQKDILENELLFIIKKNNLEHLKVNIDNSKIICNNTSSLPSLSYKFLEESLNEYLQNKEESKNICSFIKKKRESNKKKSISLKRVYK